MFVDSFDQRWLGTADENVMEILSSVHSGASVRNMMRKRTKRFDGDRSIALRRLRYSTAKTR
jgi:hypothetical protein